jgi:hypothetical protein
MIATTDTDLRQWLAQGDRALELLLHHCHIRASEETQTLQIACPSRLFEGVLEYSRVLNWQAGRSLIQRVEFYRETRLGASHELTLDTAPLKALETQQIDPLGLMLLKNMGVAFDRAIAIVEMGSNRPIFCTSGVLAQSKAGNINNWLEQPDMSVYHYPDQLKRLENAAMRGVSPEFAWTAKTFDFDDVEITANIYLGELNNRLVRICENLHWQHV